MSEEIIKLKEISKKYFHMNNNIAVLKNVNLVVKKGDLISLTGPSGSGKSTLLHIIGMLDQPTTGEIFFKNKSFSKSSDKEKDIVRRNGISIIYQQNNLLNDFTALENVQIPLINNGISWNESKERGKNILSMVNFSLSEELSIKQIILNGLGVKRVRTLLFVLL